MAQCQMASIILSLFHRKFNIKSDTHPESYFLGEIPSRICKTYVFITKKNPYSLKTLKSTFKAIKSDFKCFLIKN